jgi:glycosyltransferase involved in cell wall biosynthesis
MKVAMVNTELSRGGAAMMAATLADALNSTGKVQVTLYHCGDSNKRNNLVGLRRAMSRPINAALARIGGSNCIIDFGVAQNISKFIADCDILHIHNLHGYYVNYQKLVQLWGNRPIVWTWHDMWGATGRCGYSDTCEKWRSGCNICPDLSRYPAAWFDHAAHEFLLKQKLFVEKPNILVISPSQWLADIAVQRGYSPDRVKVIPNPVDTTLFRPIPRDAARSKLGIAEQGFIALFVASDCGDPIKGYTDFAQSTAAAGVNAIAVGKRPTEPAPHIIHTGRLQNREQLNLYYSAADLLVIPSYADNYPNTVIEAMASGTPVVGYATGGIPSQLDNPYCSVVSTGDKSGLAKLLSIRSREKKTPEETRGCTAHASLKWSPVKIASQYIDVYTRSCANANC